MRTMIIPCAGSHTVNELPLFLNRHPDGELIALKSIRGVFPEKYDRIVYSVLRETEEKYSASQKIREAMKELFEPEIIILDKSTKGPAQTVYETILTAKIEGEFSVRDSHVYMELDKDYSGNFIAGLDLTEYGKTIENLRSKSFILLNEQKKVLDIIEKHFSSDVISVGLYGFMDTKDYVMAYNRLNDSNYPVNKLYVSHIISYLIGYCQRVFHLAKTVEFEDWSTKAAWQRLQRGYSTCFVDLDKICENGFLFDKKVIDEIVALSNVGMCFVGFSSSNMDEDAMQRKCRDAGMNVIAVISGCSHSLSRLLIQNKKDLTEIALEVLA